MPGDPLFVNERQFIIGTASKGRLWIKSRPAPSGVEVKDGQLSKPELQVWINRAPGLFECLSEIVLKRDISQREFDKIRVGLDPRPPFSLLYQRGIDPTANAAGLLAQQSGLSGSFHNRFDFSWMSDRDFVRNGFRALLSATGHCFTGEAPFRAFPHFRAPLHSR